jgi:PAS domain S-box-containing protein
MRAEDLLDALPIHYYVIDIDTNEILQSNDPLISIGKGPCFQQLFNRSEPCIDKTNNCFCSQIITSTGAGSLVLERGEGKEKSFLKANIKSLGGSKIIASYIDITHEKTVAKELKIHHKRMQRAEKLASFGSWEIDVATGEVLLSAGAADICGVEKNILSLSELQSVIVPEYLDVFTKEYNDLVYGNHPYNIQIHIKRPSDGQIRQIHSIAEYRSEKQMVFGVLHDLTETVWYETALQESLHDLSFAQQIARIGNWKYDPETGGLQVSDQVLHILDLKEIRGSADFRHFQEYLEGQHFVVFRDASIQALKYGIPYELQFRLKMPDGSSKWVEVICRADENPGQKGYFLRGTIQDVTLTKDVEVKLQESNNLFSTLIQNLPDAIYMKDAGYRKIIANERDARNCGKECVEEVIGRSDYEIYPLEIADRYFEDDRQVMEHGVAIINREEQLPGTPVRWMLTSKIPLKNENGVITGLVGIGHDITHRKKMEEELRSAKLKAEESDRLKSLFLANMSHEIRTPLNGILGFSSFICSGNFDPSQLEYYGRIIENCGQRLTTVIDDIIDISLIQSNQLKVEHNNFNLYDLLEELYVLFKVQKKDQLGNIKFRLLNCSSACCEEIYSDKNRLFQVMKNLLDNAFKYTEYGSVEFGFLDSEDGDLILYVKDSGIGIEESKIGVIFENFRQVEEGFSRQYEGTGLGLPIVAGIVEKLGGKVWVKSAPQKGSAFYVSIPKKRNGKNASQPAVQNIPVAAIVKPKAGVIVSFEDDPVSIEYIKTISQLVGCENINFVHPLIGIEYLRKNHADLILMDVRLPEMSGFEATRIIKSEFPHLPVIIQTAFAMKEDREKAFSAGCDDYMAKPVLLNDLKGKIRHYIGIEN